MRRILYITIGCISVVLGIIGIFVPGLPTTPFLLLSSWLFYKSSRRLHDKLHRSPLLGAYLRRFQEKKGVSRKVKYISMACMWIMIFISAFVCFESRQIRLFLLFLGVIGTVCMILFIPVAKES